MKNRTFDIHIRLTKEEAADLKRKTKMCGITQSALLRILLKVYEPREKPDDRFYDVIRRMCAIGNSLNQIARKANSLGLLDSAEYKRHISVCSRNFELRRKSKCPKSLKTLISIRLFPLKILRLRKEAERSRKNFLKA